jgi:hypothetical protein
VCSAPRRRSAGRFSKTTLLCGELTGVYVLILHLPMERRISPSQFGPNNAGIEQCLQKWIS